MDRDKIIELACHGEDMSLFSGTYIEAIHEYDGTAKDKEFLAFFACAGITGDVKKDRERVDSFLANVSQHTSSVWEYIDNEHYMIDYAFDVDTLRLLMLMHEIIMTTQTIERSVQLSRRYNDDLSSFFVKIFNNAGIYNVFPNNPYNPQLRIWTFLRLMVRTGSSVDLGQWKGDWVSAKDLLIPIDKSIVEAAVRIGATDSFDLSARNRDRITDFFRSVFPLDPSRGYYVLVSDVRMP